MSSAANSSRQASENRQPSAPAARQSVAEETEFLTLDATRGTAEARRDSRFLEILAGGLQQCELKGQAVLIGVSGGADSVALLCGTQTLAVEYNCHVVAAHLNHSLRGDASNEDARFVADLAERLQIPCHIGHRDVSQEADASGVGLEEAARRARYEFLVEAADRANCSMIATAHTADDQVETLLHHIVRGSGLGGLRGMPFTRPLTQNVRLVRPLLEARREQIEAWVTELGQAYCVDATNTDTRMTRNRIRHELLPLLRSQFNSNIDGCLLKLGEQAAAAHDVIMTLAEERLSEALIEQTPRVVRLRRQIFLSAPEHLRRECFVRLWCQQDWPRQAMGFREWDRLSRLVETSESATLPGRIQCHVRREVMTLQSPDC